MTRANAENRPVFVQEYRTLVAEAKQSGATIFLVDNVRFRADGDLRTMWVRRGTPALFDSTSPRRNEKESYYSAVCVEAGAVEAMELVDNSTAVTSTAFLQQLRAYHFGPLIVIWDNASTRGGDALRAYLTTPNLHLRLIRLPAYCPDDNADEAIRDWVREEVTANTCFGTQARVRAQVDAFFHHL